MKDVFAEAKTRKDTASMKRKHMLLKDIEET